jgi:hypothetical protein
MLNFIRKAKYYTIRILAILISILTVVVLACGFIIPYMLGIMTGSAVLIIAALIVGRFVIPKTALSVNKYLANKMQVLDAYLTRKINALEIILENRNNSSIKGVESIGFVEIYRI